jgi:hypothetical protein
VGCIGGKITHNREPRECVHTYVTHAEKHIDHEDICVRYGPVGNNQKLHQAGRLERLDINMDVCLCEEEMPASRPIIPVPINGSPMAALIYYFGLRQEVD